LKRLKIKKSIDEKYCINYWIKELENNGFSSEKFSNKKFIKILE
jgi:hypothetical protein